MKGPQRLLLLILSMGLALHTFASPVWAQRRVAEETHVFRAVRDGVFTVFGDRGHGSGFLVHESGLLLTNSHVVSSSRHISVQLDDSTRVRARLLQEDKPADIALLWISSDVVRDRPVLKLTDRPPEDLAFEGEKVLAIGSPLNQTRILTAGIVSKVEERAVISDVNLNPGNSGGPLLNLDAEVIAINTFRDPSLGGPGVSGSVPVGSAFPMIASALAVQREPGPSAELLPVKPGHPYPSQLLRWASSRSYQGSNYEFKTGGFRITIATPPRRLFLQTAEQQRLAGKRQRREIAAGAESSDLYDPLGDRLHQWREYVGDYAPVVVIHVTPEIGETAGSVFANILGAGLAGAAGTTHSSHHVYAFRGDLEDFELLVDGRRAGELFRSLNMMPVSVSVRGASMDDIAQQGVFAFLPEIFDEPHASNYTAVIQCLKKSGEKLAVQFPRQVAEQIWVDFEPYRDMLAARRQALLVR